MGKDKKILKDLEKESKQLYTTLLNMLKILSSIIKLLPRKSKEQRAVFERIVGTYQQFYGQARSIQILLRKLREDIKEEEDLERKILSAEDSIDNVVGPRKTWQPLAPNFYRTSLAPIGSWYTYFKRKQWSKVDKEIQYEHISQELKNLASFAFLVYSAWHGEPMRIKGVKPTNKEEELAIVYKRLLEELDRLGLANLHYRLSAHAADIFIRINRIVALLGVDIRNKKKISDAMKEVIRMYRYEIALLEEHAGQQFYKEAQTLNQKLRELEALV